MRWLAIAVACAGLAIPRIAHAELTAGELQARGEALAKDGRYGEAIAVFKDADRIEARASHACLIALGYARRDLWAQAEIWLAACHRRAKPDDPLPEWSAELDHQIAVHVTDSGLAPVVIVVEPQVAGAQVKLADFPDDPFGPSTIHLAAGHHQLVVSAPGYADATRDVEIADSTEHRVVITLTKLVVPTDRVRSHLLIGGAAVIGAGVVSYAVMSVTYLRLNDQMGFHTATDTIYDVSRITTIGLWAIGGGLVIAGLLHHDAEAATVSATPLPGGGMVSIGWRR